MTLRTLDEARATVAASALRLVQRCGNTDPHLLAAMLHGNEPPAMRSHDQMLTRRHRRILDHITALGYAREARDELDGITSAADLDDIEPEL